MTEVPLLVGEAPNRIGEGKRANTTFTGGRIAKLGGYFLPRTNLLREWPGPQGRGSAFPLDQARPAAARLLRRVPRRRPLLLVGTRVASAFGLGRSAYQYLEWMEHHGRRIAVLPHPSGINRWWNDPANVELARGFIEEVASWQRPSS